MFEPGMIIQNRYEIVEEVGSGGMSVVYKAKCHVLNRFVAIKVLKPEFADDKSFVSKFRIEAQSAAGLSHPNIVNVYDVGEENGFYYIVMELVEGITLKEYIQQNGRLPYKTALDFIIQICSGIEVAHEHHTIHRDIKPQNIIVSKNGTLKVTDFGIAKAATSNTIASSAMGSVHYISPEQARGGFSDERSDIYSLGITLYEMLTGRVPFEGENNVTVALMHIQSEIIPPREYYPDIPIGLEKIVLKATKKKQEHRYLTTNAMLSDLRKVAADPNADVGNASISMPDNAPTIQISEDEMSEIKNAAQESVSVFPVSQPDAPKQRRYQEMNDEYGYDSDDYEDEDRIQDEDSADILDPKTERLIKIGAVAATLLIGIIITVVGVSVSGVMKHKPATTEQEVSTESDVLRMIDVVGMDENEAVTALQQAGITYEIEREYSDTFEKGKIISQSMNENDEVKKYSTVTIVVSKGQQLADVPDVVGKNVEDAKQALENAGFEVDEDEEYDDKVSKGYVISQSPDGESQAAKKSTVKIVVSKGQEVKVSVVPDLKKKSITDAESALSGANLKLGNVSQEYSDTLKSGLVISQSISSGTEVKEGTAVDITISMGKKPTTTTYTASFSGSISNSTYAFQEGEMVKITVTLKSGDASYTLSDEWYDEASLPLDGSSLYPVTDLNSNSGISLLYSVKDSAGNDVTASFYSSLEAKLKAVEQ